MRVLEAVGDLTEADLVHAERERRRHHRARDDQLTLVRLAIDGKLKHLVEVAQLIAAKGDADGLEAARRDQTLIGLKGKELAELGAGHRHRIDGVDEAPVGKHHLVHVNRADEYVAHVQTLNAELDLGTCPDAG